MKTDILQEIVANKCLEVARQQEAVKLQTLLGLGGERLERPVRSMRAALEASPSGIIAEFKRKSPSKGWLFPEAKVQEVVPAYEANGASACSVLTDSLFFGGSLSDLSKARSLVLFFGGSLSDLSKARSLVDLPLLRKDFIVDAYQVYQARVMGADAILLIAACLTPAKCTELAELAHTVGLEVLLEIHSEEELEYVTPQIDMLGVNNRNLGTFHTDIENSFRLSGRMRTHVDGKSLSPTLISESGISDTGTIRRLREAGFRGFLIGETFMKTGHPGETLSHFIGELSC